MYFFLAGVGVGVGGDVCVCVCVFCGGYSNIKTITNTLGTQTVVSKTRICNYLIYFVVTLYSNVEQDFPRKYVSMLVNQMRIKSSMPKMSYTNSG